MDEFRMVISLDIERADQHGFDLHFDLGSLVSIGFPNIFIANFRILFLSHNGRTKSRHRLHFRLQQHVGFLGPQNLLHLSHRKVLSL